MQVVGLERIREPFPLEHGLSFLCRQNGYEEKDADALRPGGIDFGVSRRICLSLGEILKSSENWAANIRKRHIHDHQAPDSAGDLCQGVRGQRDDPDTPTLGIEDVLERALANDVVVDDQDSNFGHVGDLGSFSNLCLSADWSSISLSIGLRFGFARGRVQRASCLCGHAKQKLNIVLDKANKKRISSCPCSEARNGHFSHTSSRSADAPASPEPAERDQSHPFPHSRSPPHL